MHVEKGVCLADFMQGGNFHLKVGPGGGGGGGAGHLTYTEGSELMHAVVLLQY